MPIDLYISADWDLVVGGNGDLKTADARRVEAQEIATRMLTNHQERLGHPSFGADLARFHGVAKSQEAFNLVRAQIFQAMKYDNRFPDISAGNIDVIDLGEDYVGILIQGNVKYVGDVDVNALVDFQSGSADATSL